MGDHGTKPVQFINIIHEKYLYKICKESGLEGLAYYGAPEVKCKCGLELRCVEYDNGKEIIVTKECGEVQCTICKKKYDVNSLMVSDILVLYYKVLCYNSLQCPPNPDEPSKCLSEGIYLAHSHTWHAWCIILCSIK